MKPQNGSAISGACGMRFAGEWTATNARVKILRQTPFDVLKLIP
jgi:hypothetical protein